MRASGSYTTVSNWKMIDAVMYGMMPSAKMVIRRRLPPPNRSIKPKRRPALCVEQELKLVGVHAWGGDKRTQAVNGENAQCKQNPLAQVRNPEDIQKLLKHVWFSASGVDAARILPKSSVSAKVATCP